MAIGWIVEAVANSAERGRVVPITLFAAVLWFCIVVGHLLKESRWVNESITAIVIVFAIITKPLVRTLHPHHALGHSTGSLKEDIILPLLPTEDATASGILQAKRSLMMLMERPVHTIHAFWRKFDDTYMRPVFGGPI